MNSPPSKAQTASTTSNQEQNQLSTMAQSEQLLQRPLYGTSRNKALHKRPLTHSRSFRPPGRNPSHPHRQRPNQPDPARTRVSKVLTSEYTKRTGRISRRRSLQSNIMQP